MRVRIYYNLHKHTFSIQHKAEGRWLVRDYADEVTLKDVTFKVSEAGRKRVIEEGRKNVHAFIVGRVSIGKGTACITRGAKKVTYNPYKHDTFVTVDGEHPVTDAHIVTMGQWDGMPSVWAITPKSDIGLTNQQ